MDSKRILEERLREAACIGDTDAVQELINIGVDVNTKHAINGWTPLHWACKRGYLDVASLLLKNGADRNIKSESGKTPASVCSNPQISLLLGAPMEADPKNEISSLGFVPNYIKHPSLNSTLESNRSLQRNIFHSNSDELVLKIRIASSTDPDFVEVELPRSDLSYKSLLMLCATELEVAMERIVRLRKLPNTKLRKDKDVQRLQDFQEIEVITDSCKFMLHSNGAATSLSITPANSYQSISKKDQTILY